MSATSYYDVDAILTDAERVPCVFEIDAKDLGHLDNDHANGLKAGTQILLPIWLAELLAVANTGSAAGDSNAFVSMGMPLALSDQVMQALKADACSVPLRDQSAYFYALSSRALDILEDEEIPAILKKTLVARATEISVHARKAGSSASDMALNVGGGSEDFLRGLDEWERKLFRKAHDGTKAVKEWMESVKKH